MVNFLRSLWARYFGHFRIEEVQLVEGEEEGAFDWRPTNFVGTKLVGPCTIYKVYHCSNRLDPYWHHISTTKSEIRARAVVYEYQESLKGAAKSKLRAWYY